MSKVDGPLEPQPAEDEEWVRRFDLLGDLTRFRLLTHMHLHPDASVNELAEAAGITATAASQALRVLRDNGWVESRRNGRVMHYTLIDETTHRVLHFLGQQHHH